MFPVHIQKEDSPELPTTGNYFVIAGNGTFFHKENALLKGLVKVSAVPDLGEVVPYGELKLPLIPFELAYTIKKFFENVWKVHKSEAAVLLHYSYTDGYYISCPKQKVSGASVKYDRDDRFTDSKANQYICVGTIHSHCDFSAFHSGVDTADEADFDGLHITFGHVNKDEFSIASSIALSNNRFVVKAVDHIEGVIHKNDIYYTLPTNDDIDEEVVNSEITEWMKNVEKEFAATWTGFGKSSYTGFWNRGDRNKDEDVKSWWGEGGGDWENGSFYPYQAKKTLATEEWLYYNEAGTLLKKSPDSKDWTEVVNKEIFGLRIWKHKSEDKRIFGYSSTGVVENVGGPVV